MGLLAGLSGQFSVMLPLPLSYGEESAKDLAVRLSASHMEAEKFGHDPVKFELKN